MSDPIEFVPFPKIPRLNREIVITEKIDGTNAQVTIVHEAVPLADPLPPLSTAVVGLATGSRLVLYAGSRSRWIVPGDDNFGFAAWVKENAESLAKLGPGSHHGEWWGAGVNKRYGQWTQGQPRRFSLFNVSKWADPAARPACCDVVPVLYRGPFSEAAILDAIEDLRAHGSWAVPGCGRPEGVIIFHVASGELFKVTLEKDSEPKSLAEKVA